MTISTQPTNQPTAAHSPPVALTTVSGLALTLLLSVFAVAPLLYPGYFQAHSGYVPLWNVAAVRANPGLGWTPHLLTGFDPLRDAGLLPYYLAALLPLSPAAAVKLVLGLGWLLGGAGMFLWLRSWLGNAGALVSALVYVYLPHQLVTVYVRGAWGELLFWGLLPWAILAATFLVNLPATTLSSASENKEENRGDTPQAPRPAGGFWLLPLAALFWLALGLSQLGLTVWAFLWLAALLLVVHFRQALWPLAAALLGTVLAGLVYLLLPGATFGAAPPVIFGDHFIQPFQLFSAFWGEGISQAGWEDGLSLQLGVAALGLAMLALFVWLRGASSRPEPVSRRDRRLWFFAGAALAVSLLQFGVTGWLWAGFGLSGLLTYPWQLLGLAGLCLAVLAGALLWLEPRFSELPLLGGIAIFVILAVYPHLEPQFTAAPNLAAPPIELGAAQLALLDADFAVVTSGYTAGLERGETSVPLPVYGPPQPGDTLRLNVRWQPLRPLGQDYKVFVHLVDPNDNVLAQFDGQPREGAYPTSRWIPGEIIEDSYPVLFPADAPPGPYRAFIGLYDEATLERLPVPTDFAGRVILPVE